MIKIRKDSFLGEIYKDDSIINEKILQKFFI